MAARENNATMTACREGNEISSPDPEYRQRLRRGDDLHYRISRLNPTARRSYCLALGAARTARQSDGNCASVRPGLGFGGTFGGFGCSTESLNQYAKSE